MYLGDVRALPSSRGSGSWRSTNLHQPPSREATHQHNLNGRRGNERTWTRNVEISETTKTTVIFCGGMSRCLFDWM